MKRDLEEIKHDLSHVYWIGGTSRGGKSTVAKTIEKEFGFSVYVHDRKWVDGDHTRMADPDRHPTMFRYRHLYEDLTIHKNFNRFLKNFYTFAPLDELVEDQFEFFAEQFEMVVDDLLKRPRNQPILAEGIGLLPEQVSRVADPHRAIYLVSTEAFVRAVEDSFEEKRKREGGESWIVRMHFEYRLKLNERTISQAETHRLRVVETGGKLTIEETIDLVKAHFGLSASGI